MESRYLDETWSDAHRESPISSEWFRYSGAVNQIMDLLQWPAMVVTIIASWLVASKSAIKRTVAFWVFLLSNALWVAWGLHDHAYALILLQVALACLNIRGAMKNAHARRKE
jgi:hypothetical protein